MVRGCVSRGGDARGGIGCRGGYRLQGRGSRWSLGWSSALRRCGALLARRRPQLVTSTGVAARGLLVCGALDVACVQPALRR